MIDVMLTTKQRRKVAKDLTTIVPVRLGKFKVAIIFDGYNLLAIVRNKTLLVNESVQGVFYDEYTSRITHKFKLGLGKPIYLDSDGISVRGKLIVLAGLTADGRFIQEGFSELIEFTKEDMKYLVNYVDLLNIVS